MLGQQIPLIIIGSSHSLPPAGATPNLHFSHLHGSILHDFQILHAPKFTRPLIYTTPDLHGTYLHKSSPPNLHTPILHEIYTAPNLHVFPKCFTKCIFVGVFSQSVFSSSGIQGSSHNRCVIFYIRKKEDQVDKGGSALIEAVKILALPRLA